MYNIYGNKKYRFIVDVSSTPCANYERGWMGRCKLDNSYRRSDCKESCPRYRPTFRSRLKLAWKVLTWSVDFRRV